MIVCEIGPGQPGFDGKDAFNDMKIAVLAGGLSPERDVSLTSGSLIANSLMKSGHRVCLTDVYMGAELTDGPEDMFLREGSFCGQIGEKEPDLDRLKKESGNGDALIGKNVTEICRAADVVFVAMHGGMGENGMLQAYLDCLGVRYTGSGYEGCLLAMDKGLTKQAFLGNGIVTPPFVILKNDAAAPRAIAEKIGFPCVVKPLACGSSVGVSIVADEAELDEALRRAGVYETQVLVEKKITGREFSVGVLNGSYLPPIEIIPKSGFYDYKNKYQSGMTVEVCPAALTPEETETVGQAALAVHRTLRLGTYSRSDFILSEEDHRFYCLEANALPGMTPASLLPQEAKAAGMDYDALCLAIVNGAGHHAGN